MKEFLEKIVEVNESVKWYCSISNGIFICWTGSNWDGPYSNSYEEHKSLTDGNFRDYFVKPFNLKSFLYRYANVSFKASI